MTICRSPITNEKSPWKLVLTNDRTLLLVLIFWFAINREDFFGVFWHVCVFKWIDFNFTLIECLFERSQKALFVEIRIVLLTEDAFLDDIAAAQLQCNCVKDFVQVLFNCLTKNDRKDCTNLLKVAKFRGES